MTPDKLAALEAAVNDVKGDLISQPSVRLQTHSVITILEAARERLAQLRVTDAVADLSGRVAIDQIDKLIKAHKKGAAAWGTDLSFQTLMVIKDALTTRLLSRSALSSRAVAVPEGWQLVPIKPTYEMINSAFELHLIRFDEVAYVYRVMLSAAPQPDAQKVGRG